MAKKNIVEQEELDMTNDSNFSFDEEALKELITEPQIPVNYEEPVRPKVKKTLSTIPKQEVVSCLRNAEIIVRHLPQPGTINDPQHVLYGGMAESATMTVSVPRLRSGVFADVLTKNEKAFLEQCMGLEEGALNVYNRENNFWDNGTEGGISKVRLTKQDTILHLNDPVEYIYYKILLANKDKICPDLQTLADKPKATYKFVLISNEDVSSVAKVKMNTKKQCWMEYGKIESNDAILRMVIETITSKPLASNTKLDFLQTKAGELMDADPKLFLSVVKDPLINIKVLIKKCVEQGFISKVGDWYKLRSDGSPLCEGGEEPTFTNAARFLASPKRQEMKLALETKLKY